MKRKILLFVGLILVIVFVGTSAFAGGALPGFTSAEAPTIDKILDIDTTIHGTAPGGMTVVVTYKNETGEVTAETVADGNDTYSLSVEGSLSAKDVVVAYTKGLRTSDCMADSSKVTGKILPARITIKNLKAGSRKLTINTYPKAKVRIKFKGFSKRVTTNKKGKYVLKLSKKKKLKKGDTVKYTVTYNKLTGPTISKKI